MIFVAQYKTGNIKQNYIIHRNDVRTDIVGEHSRFVVSGDVPAGRIHLRDPLNLKVAHTLTAHSGMLNDFDVHGHHL